jgi:uncharacterized protein (DUF849 family)
MANKNRKTILSCAITGSVHTPTMSEYLPTTPQQIVENALEAAQAGAAILHLNARNPENGRASADPEHFQLICHFLDFADLLQVIENIGGGAWTRTYGL